MQYIENFSKSRSKKIGASEISACLVHPEKSESIAGYGQTAFTVWEEKTGRKKRDPAGFSAEMGHALEPVILKKWVEENIDKETSEKFYRGYMLCELEKTSDGYPNAASFQNTEFFHHTRAETDFAISHADCINENSGILIEAKSASFWSARRTTDIYSGYDLELKNHQGIPLRNFFQLQFQAAIYNLCYGIRIEKMFLALLFDTSQFCTWEVKPDLRVQERLLELADYMKKCIDTDKPPKALAINQRDIKSMYPKLNDDFRIVSADELEAALTAARQARESAEQQKAWKQKEDDAKNALAVLLKDNKSLRGIIDGEMSDIATWEERQGGERVKGLKEIKKSKRLYRYLQNNHLIKEGKPSRFVKVKLK